MYVRPQADFLIPIYLFHTLLAEIPTIYHQTVVKIRSYWKEEVILIPKES